MSIDGYVSFVKNLPSELQQLVLAFSLGYVDILQNFSEFDDILNNCIPYTAFSITQDDEADDNDSEMNLDIDSNSTKFVIESSCLLEPTILRGHDLPQYLPFFLCVPIDKVVIFGDCLHFFDDYDASLTSLAVHLINKSKDTVIHVLRSMKVLYTSLNSISVIDGIGNNEALQQLEKYSSRMSSLQKVTVYMNDDDDNSTHLDLELLSSLANEVKQLDVKFVVDAPFFERSDVLKLLSNPTINFQISSLYGPINMQIVDKFGRAKIERLFIDDLKSLEFVPRLRPEHLDIELDELTEFHASNDFVGHITLNIKNIRNCAFENLSALRSIYFDGDTIDLRSLELLPKSLEHLSLSSEVVVNGDPQTVYLPEDLQDITFVRKANLSFFNFSKCKKLVAIELSRGLKGTFEDAHVWKTLPSSLKKIVIYYDKEEPLDLVPFGLTINEEIVQLDLVIHIPRGQRAILFLNSDKDFYWPNIPNVSIFKVNNISKKVRFKNIGARYLVFCLPEDEHKLISKNEEGLPYKKLNCRYGLSIFETEKGGMIQE